MRLLAFKNVIYLKSPLNGHVGLSPTPTHRSICNPYTYVYVQPLQRDLHASSDWLVVPSRANAIILHKNPDFFFLTSLKKVYIQPEYI